MGTVSPQDWGRGSSWAPGAETGPALREAEGRWRRVQPGSGRGALNSRPHPNYGILDQLGKQDRTVRDHRWLGRVQPRPPLCSPAHPCSPTHPFIFDSTLGHIWLSRGGLLT